MAKSLIEKINTELEGFKQEIEDEDLLFLVKTKIKKCRILFRVNAQEKCINKGDDHPSRSYQLTSWRGEGQRNWKLCCVNKLVKL